MKRYFCLLSLLITCTGFLSAEAIQIGDYYYNLNDANKTAEFTRKFSDTYKYVSTVEIPSSVVYNGSTYKVTRIADWTFSSCYTLTSVTIPNSVTRIGEWAFHECTGLTSIEIPNSVTYIGENAFYKCTHLTSVTIPNSISIIEKGVFQGCTNLTSIEIPHSVTHIREGSFSECTSLTAITIPNSVTRIGESAFSGCTGLKSVTISKNVNAIDNYAFSRCSNISSIVWKAERCSVATYMGVFDGENVTSFTFGNDVKEIPNHICSNMKKLTEVVIPEGVTTIGKYAFIGCSSLTSITIPNSVTTISEHVFRGCTSLTSVTISNSVTSIGEDAFSGCSSLKSINIPNTVISIGKWAFSGCTDLTSFNVSPENMNYSSWDGVLYNKDHTILYAYPNKKSTSYVIPNGVTTIGRSAFSGCTSLTSITIPNSVTTISEYAFSGCTSLTSITIPNSVTTISESAFSRCTGLKSINIPNSVTRIEKNAFYDCENLWVYTAANVSIPDVSYDHIKKVTPQELLMHNPFPAYAKNYVEKHINQWQQRGEFERTAEWQARVNEETRQQKINELLAEAERKYTDYYKQSTSLSLTLGRYDADNEVFVITDTKYGNIYMAVPYKEAQKFKENWYNKNVSYELQIKDGEIGLASVSILMPKRKQYTYRNTDAVNYNLAEIDYNFAPIELNLTSSDTQSDKQKNQMTTIRGGKSIIDTDIPTTEASNPNTFVIIFANEDYKNVVSVPFAKNDGTIFQKYCQKTLGIPTSNIHYVENASYNDIRIQLAWLNDVCDAFDGNASIIVYYSGHGIPDEASKSAYLLPVDGDGRYVQSAYKVDDLYQKLGAMNTKSVTIFMDACFSGATRSNTMVAQAKGVALKAKNSIPQGRTVVFSAAQGDESAGFFAEEGHGLFTYYLLKKLQETKGDVSLQDLGEYIITNVRQQSIVKNGKLQTPTVLNSPSATDWQTWKLK